MYIQDSNHHQQFALSLLPIIYILYSSVMAEDSDCDPLVDFLPMVNLPLLFGLNLVFLARIQCELVIVRYDEQVRFQAPL